MAEMATRKKMPYIRDDLEYYKHQVDGIRHMARMKSFILADQMGLGKSLEALTVFAIDVVMGWSSKCIIVCPASLKGNWGDEIDKFTYGMHYTILQGSPLVRNHQITEFFAVEGPKILICNYEQVKTHLFELNALEFDVAIFDEAHYIKNPKSQRTKACLNLASRRNFMLTGTPLLNHVNELWSLLHKVDPNRFPKYFKFVNRYCVFGGFEQRQIVATKNERELKDILKDYMIRRLKKDVLDLPEVQVIERRVTLTDKQRRLYDKIDTELEIEMANGETSDFNWPIVRATRLRQAVGTCEPFTGEDESAKLDLAVDDDIELLEQGEKTVTFTQMLPVQAAYIRRLQAVNPRIPVYILNGEVPPHMRKPTVDAWAAVDGPAALVCMLQVAGIGLNMTAAKHGAFLDKLFVPGLNQQAIDRLHRIGSSTTQPIQIRDYLARSTVDTKLQSILNLKTKLSDHILEMNSDWTRKLIAALEEDEAA